MTSAKLAARIADQPRPLLLAFDVDGTLAPIVDDPAAARVPPETRALLRRLVKTRGVRVALVTGRDLASLTRMIRLPGAFRALEHGRRLIAPAERATAPKLTAADRSRLDRFADWAQAEAVPRGARLEHKSGARAVHVRELTATNPKLAQRLLQKAKRRAEELGLQPRDGRSVVEAELEAGDKGHALERIRRATRSRGVFYVGDDVTDYPAIRKAGELGGVGVFVLSKERPRSPRGASASVAGPDGLRALLEHLLGLLSAR